MARIAVAAFRHASSSFLPTRATILEFEKDSVQPLLARGAPMLPAIEGRNLALAGFASEATALGHEVVPLVWAAASASGPVTEDAFEQIIAIMLEELAAAGPVDGVALSLHGAMSAVRTADADGEAAARLRRAIGASVPLVALVDWHANISPQLVAAATSIHVNRTCPASDADATGRRAARDMDRLLRGGDRLARCFRRLPFLLPLAVTAPGDAVAAAIVAAQVAEEAVSGVDHLAFAAGFPGADVPHAGPAVVGYGDDRAAVERAVARLAQAVAAARPAWRVAPLDPVAAVAMALSRVGTGDGPVLLAEIDDDPDAGGTGDGMWLAHALLAAGVPDAVLGFLCEPHVATIASRAGIGAMLPLLIGGKYGLSGDTPLTGVFRVEALAEGPCVCNGPVHAGAAIDPGPMAVLRLEGLRLVVTVKRVAADDRQLFAHAGISPESVPILAVKSALAYRADLAGLAAAVIPVAGGGPMPADPARLPFRRLRRGMAAG